MNRILISNTTAAPRFEAWVERSPGINPAAGEQQYIYTVGRPQASFPSLSVEKEFFQAIPVADVGSSGKEFDISDEVSLKQLNLDENLQANLYGVLSRPENFYIAREMCWHLVNTEGNESYTIIPTSNKRLNDLVTAIKPADNNQPGQYIAIGHFKSGVVNSDCLDGGARVIMLDHLLPVSSAGIVAAVTKLDSSINNGNLQPMVDEILSLNGNEGITEHDRALNYVLYNNYVIYQKAYQHMYDTNSKGPNPSGYQLVNVRSQWVGSSNRKVVRVIFEFAGIDSGATQSWYSTVDVTGEFPFLLTDYARYLQRV